MWLRGLPGLISILLTVAACLLTVAACGSSGGGSTAGGSGGAGSGGAGGASGLTFRPCSVQTRVGGFSITLVAAAENAPAYAQIAGGVKDSVRPSDVWEEIAKDGSCRLMVSRKLECAPDCPTSMGCMNPGTKTCLCAGSNICVVEPASQGVGTVTVTGLAVPVAMMPIGASKSYYFPFPDGTAYPPYTAGAAIGLSAAGADFPAFAATARGIDPLAFPPQILNVAGNQPLAVSWTAPSAAGAGRIGLLLDIAHHGGIAARIECDLPDTGAATVPAVLITQLMGRGTAGFPLVSLTRRQVDSATIPAGCVEFTVASSIEQLITVEGVTSCSDEIPCPDKRECRFDRSCAP